MTDRLIVSTRKGLFTLDRASGAWDVSGVAFLGDSVLNALVDPRDGAVYASLSLGHFGAKLHRAEDGGATWTELGVPVYPDKP